MIDRLFYFPNFLLVTILKGSPTKWGLVEKRNNELLRENDKYVSQLPDITEYADRFQKHSKESYGKRVTTGSKQFLN